MTQRSNGHILNHNISVDCVLFGFDGHDLKILLIEQKDFDEGKHIAQYALPGDLVFDDEDLDQAALRVLEELANLKNIYLKQFHSFGDINRVKDLKDQDWLRTFRSEPAARVITVAYYSLVNLSEYNPEPASFAAKSFWQKIDSIPRLAFDHNLIAEAGFKRLQEDFEHQMLGFELLPRKFTLTQLQKLYEIVLNKKLDKRNFRKKLKKEGLIEALDEKQEGVLHKPAQLYQVNKP
jgi:hypothetical protein